MENDAVQRLMESQRIGYEISRNEWAARAATAEEKVKDWSVRACEAEARIRELEAQLKDAGYEDHRRIQKAREILNDLFKSWGQDQDIQRALDALDGK